MVDSILYSTFVVTQKLIFNFIRVKSVIYNFFQLPLIHGDKELNLLRCGTHNMFGFVGNILRQEGLPTFISI